MHEIFIFLYFISYIYIYEIRHYNDCVSCYSGCCESASVISQCHLSSLWSFHHNNLFSNSYRRNNKYKTQTLTGNWCRRVLVSMLNLNVPRSFGQSAWSIERRCVVTEYCRATWYRVVTVLPSVPWHYNDVIIGVMVSQITSLTIVYSTVYSGLDQRKQSRGKCFHLMTSSRGILN